MFLHLLAACVGGPDDSSVKGDDCPVASIDTTALSWSDVVPGTGEDQTLTLGNSCSGESALSVDATLEGATFSLDASSWSIAPGALARVTVTYTPDDGVADGGTLRFETSDPARPDIVVTLSGVPVADQDGDGFLAGEDCDDLDADVNPSEEEIWYDGVDQDCDGNDDDQDGDGHPVGEDCDDLDTAIHPGAPETWYDGTDQDCDGNDDDQDEDGVPVAEDCDDTDPTVHPGAAETWYDGTDQDCDGNDDDQDVDGFPLADDCDDTDPAVHPGAAETWYDGTDQDCDGNDDDQDEDGVPVADDCEDTDPAVHPGAPETWYDGVDADCAGDDDFDRDGDGVEIGPDCDDGDAAVNPEATEIWYDGADQDCAGDDDFDRDGDGSDVADDCDDGDATVHPGAAETWYDGADQDCAGDDDFDQDADGHALSDDCDDTDAAVHPGAAETWYDGVDQDCAGDDDFDQDADGVEVWPTGADCADTDPTTTAGSEETRNGLDDDCDGEVDEGLIAAGDVLITEFLPAPSFMDDAYAEWIELTNVSTATVDLAGWVVEGDDGNRFTISALSLEPGEVVALGASADTTRNGGYTPDYVYDRSTFSLADSSDTIRLRAGSTTIAEVRYSLPTWPLYSGIAIQLDGASLTAAYAADPSRWCIATELMPSWDQGTPGEVNELCGALDHDGDGVSTDGGDCDDLDGARTPGEPELEGSGVDEDCDNLVDEDSPPSGPYLDGVSSSAYHAPRSVGDFDGDGAADVAVLGAYSSVVRFVPGADYASWAGPVTSYDFAELALPSAATYGWGAWNPAGADLTGDGNDDLVGTRYQYSSGRYSVSAYVWDGPFSGSIPTGSEAAVLTDGTTGTASFNPALCTVGDYDGDGIHDLLVGNIYSARGVTDGGMVAIWPGGSFSGRIGVDTAEWVVTGTGLLGYDVDAADADGDGYDDLAVSELESVHLLGGIGLQPAGTYAAADIASTTVSTPGTYAIAATLVDSQGDGAADLYFGYGEVYAVHDVASRSGLLTLDDTDAHLSMAYSAYQRARPLERPVDFDADGTDDLPVYTYDAATGTSAMLWFAGAGFVGEVAPTSALATWQFTPDYGFQGPTGDLDGDGDREVLLTTPYSDEAGAAYGRLWVYEP